VKNVKQFGMQAFRNVYPHQQLRAPQNIRGVIFVTKKIIISLAKSRGGFTVTKADLTQLKW
jgi:hypothetical protein